MRTKNRPEISDQALNLVEDMLQESLKKTIEKHGLEVFSSPHEAYGLLAEEFKELLDAVHTGNLTQIVQELIDIEVGAKVALASLYELS